MYASKARTFVSCFVLCAAVMNGFGSVQPAFGAAAKGKALGSADTQIRAEIFNLRTAINSGDATKVADFWTPSGVYTDDEGNKYIGRAALRNALADIYLHNGKPSIDLAIQRIEVPVPGTAVVDGVVQKSGTPQALNYFSMTFVRSAGAWKIASAVESPLRANAPTNNPNTIPLTGLEWFVGKWQAKNAGREVDLSSEWEPRKNFIVSKYSFNTGTQPETETQVIGWNPQTGAPKSWLFSAGGAYSTGDWTKVNDNTWEIRTTAMQPDGSIFSAKNTIKVEGPNAFTWQSSDRTMNGTLLPDTDAVRVERVAK